jgi:hypothetical protein
VIGSVIALYFNCFVLVVQLFEKVRALTALAPIQSEQPFLATQIIVLAVFAAIGIGALFGFRGRPIGRPGVGKTPMAFTGSAFKLETQNVQNQELPHGSNPRQGRRAAECASNVPR